MDNEEDAVVDTLFVLEKVHSPLDQGMQPQPLLGPISNVERVAWIYSKTMQEHATRESVVTSKTFTLNNVNDLTYSFCVLIALFVPGNK